MQDFFNFDEYEKYSTNKEKERHAVITGACGRVGSIFTSELLASGAKIICLSRSKKNAFSKRISCKSQKNRNFPTESHVKVNKS